MHRIKQYCRTAFQLLIIVLLSSCLVVWRLIKHVLDRKMKKEDNEEVKPASTGESRVAPVLLPDVEPENKPVEAEGIKSASVGESGVAPVLSPDVEPGNKPVEAEDIKPASTGESGIVAVLSPDVELGDKPIEAEGIKPASTGESGVAPVLLPDVEPENKPIEAEVETENSVLVLEVAEAHCVKCRQKQPIQGARKVTTKKGRPAIEGTCAVCGAKLFRFLARKKENLSGEG
jgi:hypothetical protein